MPDYNDRIHKSLPIYALNWEMKNYLYSPGLAFAVSNEEQTSIGKALISNNPDNLSEDSKKIYFGLLDFSAKQYKIFKAQQNKEFIPECLTINISNDCNLDCSYCYTRPHRHQNIKNQLVNIKAVEAASRLVAENCKLKGKPFTVVFHGGGEPTFHWKYLTELHALTKKTAELYKIPYFSYISTNGYLNLEKANWLASHFDLVGISIDGPSEIQDKNRRTAGGDSTSKTVPDSVIAIVNQGGKVEIRSTITRESMLFQREIIQYLIKELSIKSIRFEPEYGGQFLSFIPDDAEAYENNFIEAERYASLSGAKLHFSGVRLNEIHGVYCDVLRNNLRIGPDSVSVNCFYNSNPEKSNITGSYDIIRDIFLLNNETIKNTIYKAAEPEHYCRNCFLEYHCSRGCPDFCRNDSKKNRLVDFRCEVHRKLALNMISHQ